MEIAVIGAGISGLQFAAAMRQRAPLVRVSLYERDDAAGSHGTGYAIGIRAETGMRALGDLGLAERIIERDAIRVGTFVFTDQRGRTLLRLPARADGKYATYRVQRSRLRTVLMDAAGKTEITFGATCTGRDEKGDSTSATFEDGRRVTADYLVAADGVASAIRQQLLGDARRYLGLSAIYGDASLESDDPLLAGGYFMTLGRNGASFFAYRQPDGLLHFSYTVAAADPDALSAMAGQELLGRVDAETRDWHALVRAIVGAARPETIGVRGYYDKKPLASVRFGRTWLIGDAAHPMSPFQGQGANMAMLDAMRLADYFAALTGDPAADGPRAAAVDREIAERGRKAVLESRSAARRFHEPSRVQQALRNVGFRMANLFIGRSGR